MLTRFAFAPVVLLMLLAPVAAQSSTTGRDEHKAEVGALFTTVNLQDFGTVNGLGARVGYNFDEHFALDTEASFFPETHLGNNQIGQKTQAFAGIKAGGRTRWVGLFAKLRPGVMSIGELTTGVSCSSGGAFTTCRPRHSAFALDAGGVFEFYPSSRSIVRVDAGDTIVRQRVLTGFGLFGPAQTSTNFTHNFQASVGFGYRF